MKCGVMEQTDGAALHPARYPLRDLRCREIFPIQAVPIGSSWKVFRCIVIKPKFVRVVLQGSSYGALNGVIRLKHSHIAVAWLHIIPLKGAREYENCQYVFHYR